MEPVYRPVIGLALSIFKAMRWSVVTTRTEHIPTSGPAVLGSNHVGYLDFVFVGYAARERGRLTRFMAKKEVFDHPVAGPLMRGMKHIPVDRYGDREAAMQDSIAALRRGEVIGMFPEGTISRSFVPRSGKTGAARLAMAADAPLIPCAVWGTQRILTKGRPKNFERGVLITVDVGEPVTYTADEDPQAVTDRLMGAVTKLAAEAERRYPQNPETPNGEWWIPAHLGGGAPTVEEADALAARERQERQARRAGRERHERGRRVGR